MKRLILLIILLFLLITSACSRESEEDILEPSSFKIISESEGNNKVELQTEDNITLRAIDYFNYSDISHNLILVHGLGGKKEDWESFAQFLRKKNFRVLSIDLRGHGQSDLSWENLNEEDFEKMIFDIDVARNYLYNQTRSRRVSLIGASLGANLIAEYLDEYGNKNIQKVVLLSPGENYRGLSIEGIETFRDGLFVVASTKDEYSVNATNELKKNVRNMRTAIYGGSAHGIAMLDENSELQQDISAFISE